MNEAMKTVLSMSFSGSLLILFLSFCRHFLKNRISRLWQYYICLLVIARLLLPFAPEENLMNYIFTSASTSIFMGREQAAIEEPAASADGNSLFADSDGRKPDETILMQAQQPIYEVIVILANNIWLIWLFTALALLLRKITVYQSFVRFLKAGQSPVEDTGLLDCLAIAEKQAGVKRAIELCVNPLVSSPLIYGFCHPCIVLPGTGLSKKAFYYTMLHELTHYKRRDMFYKWLVQITICLHWFNPLIHFMGREINKDCELSCDEAIIKKLDFPDKQEYGKTLLEAMRGSGKYRETLACVTLCENKKILKERLCSIMQYKKKSKAAIALTLLLTVLISIGAMASGAYVSASGKNKSAQKDLESSRILYENGVYYVLCSGASEADKPSSGVSEGYISIVLVRKDSYTAIGPFSDSDNLTHEAAVQCKSMVKKNYMTQEDADYLMDAIKKIQASAQKKENKSDAVEKEYAKWGIMRKGGAYYYQNDRVRIFMDMRSDKSFVNFHYDKKKGKVDIRLVRNKKGDIEKVEYLTEKEADAILADMPPAGGKATS